MSEKYYYLKGKELIECETIEKYWEMIDKYGESQEIAINIVTPRTISISDSKHFPIVSTCCQYRYTGKYIFQTIIIGGEHTLYSKRYATYDDAIAGHWRIVRNLKTEIEEAHTDG